LGDVRTSPVIERATGMRHNPMRAAQHKRFLFGLQSRPEATCNGGPFDDFLGALPMAMSKTGGDGSVAHQSGGLAIWEQTKSS